jgi:hypothetical protein
MGFIRIPGVDVSDADALVSDVKAPKTFYSIAPPRKLGTMPTVTVVAGSNTYPQGYHAGDALGLKHKEPNLQAAFISAGVNIFGTIGTYGYFDRYYPVIINSSLSVLALPAPAQSIGKNAPLVTVLKRAYDDQPADYIKRITPILSSAKSVTTIAAADQSIAKNAPIKNGVCLLCDGFVEETAAAVQTDHTAEAREGTANDLNLCPMSDTVLDKIYIGSNYIFWQAQIQVGTVGAGNWTNVIYYWNGAAWTAVIDENDGSSSFFHAPSGMKFISHTPQGDWALLNIMGMNLYWIMVRTDNFVNRVTKPLGSQIWVAL